MQKLEEVGDQEVQNQEIKNQEIKVVRSKSGVPRPTRSGPELEDKQMRKSHSIFDSFQFTYKLDLRFDLEKSHQPFEVLYPCT